MEYIILSVMLLVLLGLVMTGAWVAQRRTGNSGWVDAFWTFGTGGAASLGALAPLGSAPLARRGLVAALVLVWAFRLGFYIVRRTRAITHEDARYARFRADWGAAFEQRMFWLLMIQAIVAWVLVIAVMIAAHDPAPMTGVSWGWTLAGLTVFAGSLWGEAVADAQMHAFRANPANRGQVCDRGLWGWSRHPNYFFEASIWLAYPLIGLAGGWAPGLLALIGPLGMVWLLTKISGIPPLEREMLESRPVAYAAYQARVSAFFPRPPRRRA
jgi:steroid 5-alpha reductase family enzyme